MMKLPKHSREYAALGLGVVWMLVLWQAAMGTLRTDRVPLRIEPEAGTAFHAKARLSSKLLKDKPWLVQGWVEEDGRALPARSGNVQDVMSSGQGRYILKGRTVWFSTVDGVPLAAAHRSYVLAAGRPVPGWLWWALGAGTLGVAWCWRGELRAFASSYLLAAPAIGDGGTFVSVP